MEFIKEGFTFQIPDEFANQPSPADPRTLAQRIRSGQYEDLEIGLSKKYITAGDSVLELGACIGVIGSVVNRILENKTNHVVVEANPYIIPALMENKLANGGQFHIFNGALNGTNEKVNFGLAKFIMGCSRRHAEEGTVEVEGITKESLEEKFGVKFNAIIMDIEGSEYEAIMEYPNLFDGIDKFIVEFHEPITAPMEKINAKLKEFGLVQKDPLARGTIFYGRE